MPGKNGDRRSNPSHGEDTGENEGLIGYPVLARSPDLARVLTIRSPSVQSVVLAVVLLDLAVQESRELRYILNPPIRNSLF